MLQTPGVLAGKFSYDVLLEIWCHGVLSGLVADESSVIR